MGEWIHVKTNSAKKYCFVLKWMVFLSSSVHGYKNRSAKEEEDVEDSSSAHGLGEGRVVSSTSSVCITTGCGITSSLGWSKDVFYHRTCSISWWNAAVPLSLSSAVLPCDLPKVTGSHCPLQAFPLPLASHPIIMRSEKIVFHLANLMEESGAEERARPAFCWISQLTLPPETAKADAWRR